MSQLVLPSTWLELLPPDLRDAYGRAADHVSTPHTRNTLKAYRAAWKAWAAHCKRVDIDPLPVAPEHLCGWLASLTGAPNTVRLKLAALCSLDQGHAVATGDRDRPALRSLAYVQRWLKGWSLEHAGTPLRRAPAMAVSDLERVVMAMAEPAPNASRAAHALRFARDKCAIVLGVAGALRVSELAALEVADVALSARGVILTIRKSKTNKHAPQEVDVLPQNRRAICPVEALAQWLRIRGNEPGPVFLAISRAGALEPRGLTEGSMMRLITDRCRAAGVDAATSHSLRATCGTLLKDKPLSSVMAHGRWKSARVAADYQRRGKLLDADGVTGGLFDER